MPAKWTPDLDADLIRLYNAGASERTIATALDRSMGSVQSRTQRLREQGVLQARPRTKAVLKTGPSLANVRYKEATGVGPWGGKKLENVELKFSPTWSLGCAVEWAHRWGLELEEVRPRA